MGSGINQAHDPGSLKVFPLGIPLDFTFEEVKYCCTYLWLASNEIRWEDKKLFVCRNPEISTLFSEHRPTGVQVTQGSSVYADKEGTT